MNFAKKKCILLLIYSLLSALPLLSQVDSTFYDFGDFGGIILLDSIVVSASRNSLDIQDFVDMVRNDRSFYKAFNNIRTLSYTADNHINMYNKKKKIIAEYYSLTKQYFDGKCRSMEVLQEEIKGNFFKKKRKYRYYTAKMYDHLFFTKEKICHEKTDVIENSQTKGIDKHVAELKKLIFNPGEKADVPFMGNKTEIFSKEMTAYYDYSITSKTYKDTIDCYVFSVKIKPEFADNKKRKTVIKELETYFEKTTFQVIARNYNLAYWTTLYDFDVNIEIELKKIKNFYVPDFIKYQGWWDIPLKKPEIAVFSAKFYDFH